MKYMCLITWLNVGVFEKRHKDNKIIFTSKLLILLIFSGFEVVELPCALTLECYVVRFIAIYTAVVEIEALGFLGCTLNNWNKFYCATNYLALAILIALGSE